MRLNVNQRGYAAEFEMIVDLKIGDHIRETHIRFRNFTDYEAYINSIDQGYDAKDSIFNGNFYKIDTPVFNMTLGSPYRNACDLQHEIIETMEELKSSLNLIETFIREEDVNSLFQYVIIPKKIEPQMTDFIVYDLETLNTDRTRPNIMTVNRLSKLAVKHNRDLAPCEIEKCQKDTLVFDGNNCNSNALDFFIKIQRRRTQS